MKSGFGYPATGINNEAFTSRKVTRTVENLLTFKAFQHQEHSYKSNIHSTVNVVTFLKNYFYFFGKGWRILIIIVSFLHLWSAECEKFPDTKPPSFMLFFFFFFFVGICMFRHFYTFRIESLKDLRTVQKQTQRKQWHGNKKNNNNVKRK